MRLLSEERRRGLGAAQQVVFISDGAVWTEDTATKCFPRSTRILDSYHANERIHQLAQGLEVEDSKQRTADWREKLLADGVGEVIEDARRLQEQGCTDKEAMDENLGFPSRHRHRMLYGTYRTKR